MEIKLQKREIVGKQSKQVRKMNQVPASVYGPSRESLNTQVDPKEFSKVFKSAGYNRLIDLTVEGEKESHKALIKEVQMNPITDELLHISFYQVDMNKHIVTAVPVIISGLSLAVKNNIGLLVSPVSSIKVRCFPKEIPASIEIDTSVLNKVGDSVCVGDIKLEKGVEWDSSVVLSEAIVYIAPPQKIAEEAVAATAEAAAPAAEKKKESK